MKKQILQKCVRVAVLLAIKKGLLICTVIGLGSALWAAPKEAPNLFLPERWRGVPAKDVPAEVVDQALLNLNAALATMNLRLAIPIQKQIGREPVVLRYFEYLDQEIGSALAEPVLSSAEAVLNEVYSIGETEETRSRPRNVSDTVTFAVNPSAGVIRAEIALVYSLLLSGYRAGIPPEKTIAAIIDGSHSVYDDKTGNLSGIELRGLGSDFDVYISTNRPDLYETIRRRVISITTSAEMAFGLRWNGSIAQGIKFALFQIPDARPLHDMPGDNGKLEEMQRSQLDRAIRQGGAQIDWLYFDRKRGEITAPPSHPDIARNILLGIHAYSPRGEKVEEPFKQTVRGMRALLELPYLDMDSESEAIYIKELDELITAIEDDSFSKLSESIRERIYKQFERTKKNARFGGAWNRIYQGEGPVESRLRKVVRLLSEIIQPQSQSIIPAYIGLFPMDLHGRSAREVPAHLLMTREVFDRKYTEDKFIYHGTKSIADGLAILRNNYYITEAESPIRRGAFLAQRKPWHSDMQAEKVWFLRSGCEAMCRFGSSI